jgi:hypothetical protein
MSQLLLSEEYREHFLKTRTDLAELRYLWKHYRHAKTGTHHLIYLAVQGKDWRKAFAPLTNPTKVSAGGYYTWGMRLALNEIRDFCLDHGQVKYIQRTQPYWYRQFHQEEQQRAKELLAPFGGVITSEMLRELSRMLPAMPAYPGCCQTEFRPEHYEAFTYPPEADREC